MFEICTAFLYSATGLLYLPVPRCLFPGAGNISFTSKSSHKRFVCVFLRFPVWSPGGILAGGTCLKFLFKKYSGTPSGFVPFFESFDCVRSSFVPGPFVATRLSSTRFSAVHILNLVLVSTSASWHSFTLACQSRDTVLYY